MHTSDKDKQGGHQAFAPSRRSFLRGMSTGTMATIVTAGRPGHLPEAALAQDQAPKPLINNKHSF